MGQFLNYVVLTENRHIGRCISSFEGHDPETLFLQHLECFAHFDLGTLHVLVDELDEGFVGAAKVFSVGLHELGDDNFAVDEVDADLGLDNLADEAVKAFLDLFLVGAVDDLDMLDKVVEVEADEVDARVPFDPLTKSQI